MFDAEAPDHFDLRRVSDREWVIHDLRYASDDARCVVACIWETDDDDAQVFWLDGRMMPTSYASVDDVLEHLIVASQRGRGGTRPIEIPHLPPPRLVG